MYKSSNVRRCISFINYLCIVAYLLTINSLHHVYFNNCAISIGGATHTLDTSVRAFINGHMIMFKGEIKRNLLKYTRLMSSYTRLQFCTIDFAFVAIVECYDISQIKFELSCCGGGVVLAISYFVIVSTLANYCPF